jgi:gp16 family phage-associated protein
MTPEEIKSKFKAEGKTITEWAKENGYSRNAVYRVLNGFDKGNYGNSFKIAQKLGLTRKE